MTLTAVPDPVDRDPFVRQVEHALQPRDTLRAAEEREQFPLVEHVGGVEDPAAARRCDAGRGGEANDGACSWRTARRKRAESLSCQTRPACRAVRPCPCASGYNGSRSSLAVRSSHAGSRRPCVVPAMSSFGGKRPLAHLWKSATSSGGRGVELVHHDDVGQLDLVDEDRVRRASRAWRSRRDRRGRWSPARRAGRGSSAAACRAAGPGGRGRSFR